MIKKASAALLAAAAALATASACSSGLVTQTSGQVAAASGASANTGEAGEIALRGVMIAYNGPQGYPVGGNAPLLVRIFNGGLTPVQLVGVDASGVAARVEKVSDSASPPAEATPDPSPGATGEPTPGATPTPTETAFAEVPAAEYRALVPGTGAYLQLVDLTEAIGPGQTVPVTFRLTAGGQTHVVAMIVPVAPPETALPRETAEGH